MMPLEESSRTCSPVLRSHIYGPAVRLCDVSNDEKAEAEVDPRRSVGPVEPLTSGSKMESIHFAPVSDLDFRLKPRRVALLRSLRREPPFPSWMALLIRLPTPSQARLR